MRTVALVALPVAVIAGITLYAGLYHMLIHVRVRGERHRRDLYFALLALLLGTFDLICIGLYTSDNELEGVTWQRLSLAVLAFSSTCLIYFIDSYAEVPGPRWARMGSWSLVLLGLLALFERRGWLLTDTPMIKHVQSHLFGEVVYHEMKPGPLFYWLYAAVFYVVIYVCVVARRAFKARQTERAWALLAGMAIYLGGFVYDGLIESGRLRSVFVIEYAFSVIIALVGYSLSAEFVEAARAKQQLAERDVRLSHAQRLESVGKLAGGVAHDLNNFLTPVLGYVQLAHSRLPKGSAESKYLEQALAAAERAANLTRQLLALGRKQVLEVRSIDLGENVRTIAPLLKKLLPENVRLQVEVQPGLDSVEADAAQLEQVWMNLAANARDAMPDGGTLTYKVAAEGDGRVTVRVRDTGTGMPPELVQRIFEPFFTTKARGHGTGLGLSIVRGVVEQHGGQIDVQTAPASGTTFALHFPTTLRATPRENALERTAATRASGQLLVVDDDEAVRSFAVEVLTQRGYEVRAARSVAAARDVLSQLSGLDLLVSDVMLEDGDGLQVREHARAAFPAASCLFITGHADELLAPRGMLREGMPLLRKPFTGDVLCRKVASLLFDERARGAACLSG